jgi:hypothetical protein
VTHQMIKHSKIISNDGNPTNYASGTLKIKNDR